LDPDLERRLSVWMKQAQEGDRAAYECLLNEVAAELRAFVGARLQHREWVDDVVQDTLISLHRARHTYDPGRPFGAWMYAIARHRLIDCVRRRRRVQSHEQGVEGRLDELSPAADELPAAQGLLDALQRALPSLSEKQREVIQLLKLQGLSVREAAAQTGMTESSVKVSAHRGYRALRRLLGSDFDAD
jgi:RNA polymerase sigma-70 factor (ECF subfamily)